MNARAATFLKAVQRSFLGVLFVVFVLSSNSLADTVIFSPVTGQTTCYDGAGNVVTCPPHGDPMALDGSYSSNPETYTDNGNGTVTDNKTQLIWQKNENPSSYNWYQALGKQHPTYNPSSQDVCGSLIIGDYSDWRLPSKRELMTIVNDAIPLPGPTINTAYFPNAFASLYWSSTKSISYPDNAWAVDFLVGAAVSGDKDYEVLYVRCVRGRELPPKARFRKQLNAKQ